MILIRILTHSFFLRNSMTCAQQSIETGKKSEGVNRLTVNTPKMHGTPHTHIKISIYILYYNKVRARGVSKKQLLTVNSVNPQA